MNQKLIDPPIACLLDNEVFSPETKKRHAALWADLETKVLGIEESEAGYTYRFPLDDGLFRDLAEFITYERLCCPFFHFALALDPMEASVRLSLSGGSGVKEFLAAELGVSPGGSG